MYVGMVVACADEVVVVVVVVVVVCICMKVGIFSHPDKIHELHKRSQNTVSHLDPKSTVSSVRKEFRSEED
jgi:hypothetical protein